MFAPTPAEEAAVLLGELDAVLDKLAGLPLGRDSDTEVLGLWQQLEGRRNRMAALDSVVVRQVQQRGLHAVTGAKTPAELGRQLLRIGIGEARARIRAAEFLGPRTGLTGEPLPALYPQVAAAVAEGTIGPAAAKTIVDTIEKLPEQVRWDQEARQLDVDALRRVGQHVLDVLDPDGTLDEISKRERHRELSLHRRADGSSRVDGELTAELTEYLSTLLDTLAAPRPEVAGKKDPRSAGQRRHDALLDICKAMLRTGAVPDCAGVTTTVIFIAHAADWHAGTGTVRTGHGTVIPTSEAKRWAGLDARLIAAALTGTGRITGISTSGRLFTEGQRLAMIARDLGCSFPNCDAPPQFCEAHHVIESQDGGETSTENGTLLCRAHHRHFAERGWACTMIDGVPHWTPPPHLDPNQTPLRNSRHEPLRC
jgi:hypothetical protein